MIGIIYLVLGLEDISKLYEKELRCLGYIFLLYWY